MSTRRVDLGFSERVSWLQPAEMVRQSRPRRTLRMLLTAPAVAATLGIAAVLAVWWLISLTVSPIVLPSPWASIEGLVRIAEKGILLPAILLSVREMYLGLAIGVSIGAFVGLIIGTLETIDVIALPYVNVLNSVPGVILLPVLVIWFGLGATTRVIFVILITVWPMVINVRAGVRNSAVRYQDLSRVFGLTKRATMIKLILPASTPYLLAGLRISLGLAIIGMIVGEMEVSYSGLGFLLVNFGESLQTANLVGVVFMATLIGLAQTGIVLAVERRLLPWIRWA